MDPVRVKPRARRARVGGLQWSESGVRKMLEDSQQAIQIERGLLSNQRMLMSSVHLRLELEKGLGKGAVPVGPTTHTGQSEVVKLDLHEVGFQIHHRGRHLWIDTASFPGISPDIKTETSASQLDPAKNAVPGLKIEMAPRVEVVVEKAQKPDQTALLLRRCPVRIETVDSPILDQRADQVFENPTIQEKKAAANLAATEAMAIQVPDNFHHHG